MSETKQWKYEVEVFRADEFVGAIALDESEQHFTPVELFDFPYALTFRWDSSDETYQIDSDETDSLRVGQVIVSLPYTLQPNDLLHLPQDYEVVFRRFFIDGNNEEEEEPSDDTQEPTVDKWTVSTASAIETDPLEVKETTSEPPTAGQRNYMVSVSPDTSWALVARTSFVDTAPRSTDYQRYGCGYCYYTLDPTDTDMHKRDFVTYNRQYYHRTCWEQNLPTTAGPGEPVTLPVPTPLEVTQRTPILLHGGPINSLNDQPLGISKGTIAIKGAEAAANHSPREQQSFIIKNNSDQRIHVARSVSPAWCYVDFGEYQKMSNVLDLGPQQQQQVEIYTHFAHPHWHQVPLRLNEAQEVLIVINKRSFPFSASLVVLLVLVLFVIFSGWGWIWNASPREFASVAELTWLVTVTGLFFGWIMFMMPARALWLLYDSISAVMKLRFVRFLPLGGLFNSLRVSIWAQFAMGRVAHWYKRPRQLYGVALIGTLVGGLLGGVLWLTVAGVSHLLVGLVSNDGFGLNVIGFLLLLSLSVLYVLGVYLILALVLESYGLPLRNATKSLGRFLFQQGVSRVQGQQSNSGSGN